MKLSLSKIIKNIVFIISFSLSTLSFSSNFLDEAKLKVEKATIPNNQWDGPKQGPNASKDKFLVFVASDMRNGGVLGVSKGVEEAVKKLGWKIRILDGQGSIQGRTAAFNQAIALKPDGILLGGFDAKEQSTGINTSTKNQIPVVGWHAAQTSGAIDGLFFNVTTNSVDVAEIVAFYSITKSEGKAGVVIFTDSAYSVAIAKSDSMAKIIKQCKTCKLLEIVDTPLSDTSNRMSSITTSLIQKYKDNWTYALAINDLYFDFIGPTLSSAGGKFKNLQNVSAGDGSESAYQRIRNNRFQVATVPEPLNLHGWQMVDEINRAMNNEQPSGYSTPVHLVIKDNIEVDGGKNNNYDPDNNYREEYLKIWGVN